MRAALRTSHTERPIDYGQSPAPVTNGARPVSTGFVLTYSSWLAPEDSNLDKQIQSLPSYH